MNEDNLIIVDNVEVVFDVEAIGRKLRSRSSPKVEKMLESLCREAAEVARPKGGALMSPVEIISEAEVNVGGAVFTSTLMREKLSELGRAFPFVATEGMEMAKWGAGFSGMERVFANAVENYALVQARDALERAILEKYGLAQISAMNPGSLQVWPITQQVPLFKLLAPLPEKLGIELLPTFMMKPEHSVSGVYFQTDSKFHNCELCPKIECPNRRAPFNEMMAG